MADVVSEVPDGPVAAAEGCRVPPSEAGDGEDNITATAGTDDKVSIHEILEGMTNEFNKGVSPAKHADNIDDTAVVADVVSQSTTPLSPSSMVADQASKDENQKQGDTGEATAVNSEDAVVEPASEENHKDEDDGKQESLKKDNGIPRIVLTFRTIDENTDHGKKTKISSCSSNLTLVPDELANCDQIGGVSVKIENSDDNSDTVEEPSVEEIKAEEPAKETESKDVTENKVEDTKEEVSNAQSAVEEKIETAKSNPESNNVEAELAEGTEQRETTAPVTRKRRTGRPRLRALRFLFAFPLFAFISLHTFRKIHILSLVLFRLFSDSMEEQPCPKRSARRLCKESLKSTVLESAMARKEKSNYTEVNMQCKKRKYNKPGRPKKLIPGRDQVKPVQTKLSDMRHQEADTSLLTDSGLSATDSLLESSRNSIASLSENNSISDNVNEDSLMYSSSEFADMPKLSPMTRSSDPQTKLSNSIGSPGSDDIPLADIEKPFLKPATAGRPKRERGRPRGSTQAARKIAKADLYEGGVKYLHTFVVVSCR